MHGAPSWGTKGQAAAKQGSCHCTSTAKRPTQLKRKLLKPQAPAPHLGGPMRETELGGHAHTHARGACTAVSSYDC